VRAASNTRLRAWAARLCVLWLLGLAAIPGALAASPPRLHAEMVEALQDEGLAGAVWATVTPESGIVVDAAGLKDARSGTALDPEDRVHVGSIAKTLLATGVLQLASEGRLSLDTPVVDLLPTVAFDNPWAATDPVRVRHLLDHTAGLDDLRLWQFFSLAPGADTPLERAFVGGKRLLRVRSRPGSRFSYSNMGYTLLGRIVESVTGERYERHLDARLLRPLGMHDSTFGFVSQAGEHADPRLAMGHFDDGTPQAAVPIYLRPAGQFTTTARDMARFARFLMGDGRVDGRRIVDARLLRAMGTPVGTEAAAAGLQAGYGLGLATRDRHGVVGRCHSGNIVGYRAMFCLFPERQRAFFVSINTDSEAADYGRIDALLARSLGVASPEPVAPQAAALELADWEGVYVPAPNRFATFAWVDTVFGFVQLRREGDALRLKPLQGAASLLAPVGGALFRAPDRQAASHALLVSADGTRVLSTGLQSYARISTTKLALLWSSLLAGVLGLAYLLLSGLARLLARRMPPSHPAFVPVLGIVALLLPLPLFLRQSFLQLGDLTLASGLLAAATAALPLAMLVGLFLAIRRRVRGATAALDALAMLAVLQWTMVLAAWGLLPLRLWA
jgi:CubicO group peptidase (beta-lactamase class C family)